MSTFNDEDRKWLYDTMQSKGVDTGTYDDFKQSLNNKEDREWYYNKGKEYGLDLGSQEDFDKMMWERAGVNVPGKDAISPYLTGKQVSESTAAENIEARMPEQYIPKVQEAKKETSTAAKETPKAEPSQPKQQNSGYKPTWQERMAMGMNLGGVQSTIENATKGIDKIEENSKNASPFGGGAGLGNNSNLRKGEKSFNAETGQFEDTYYTTDGRKFSNIAVANEVQQNIDAINEYNRYLEALKAYGIEDIVGENKKSVDELLEEAEEERKNIQFIMDNDKEGKEALQNVIMSGGYDPTPNAKLEEREAYQVALRMLDRRIEALKAAKDNGGFWSGTGDTLFDPSSYSFGLTDLQDSKLMSRLKEKIDNGEQLTAGERTLAKNYLMNQAAQSLNKDNEWYQIGQSFGQTLSFMKDFLLTGGGFMSLAKGGMALGGKLGVKAATKALGTDFLTKNLGTRLLGKAMTVAGKGAGLIAGSEVGGLALNNTIQAASSAADITNKQIGELTIGKDGNLSFENSQSLANSVIQSQTQRIGEDASELVGVAFDAVPGILGKVIQRTPVGKALDKIVQNKFWKGFEKGLNYLGVQSVWGEGMEEEYGMARTEVLNWLTNGQYDPNAPSITDLDTQLKTWKTVGITSMLLRVPAMIVSGVDAAEYYGNKYNLKTSDRNMRSVFGDESRYQNVKAMLDGAENKDIDVVVGNLLKNGELSTDEKQALFQYANDLVILRGFNIGNIVAAANGYQAPPKVANYNIRGLHVDEVDKDGNILNSYDFENIEDLKTGLYEMQQKRADDSLHSDIGVMKARPNDQFTQLATDYWNNLDTPISYEEFISALEKPSMERTDEEQQIVAPFADILHNAVYDNTIMHEEQSEKDGEDIADTDAINIDDNYNQLDLEGERLSQEYGEAVLEWEELGKNNEDLRTEVLRMLGNGASPQEVLSSIESFRPEEVQTVINYFNTKAKFEGYMNRMAQKIDEEAANSRLRHTMKGTINGKADLNHVITITDGTNEYYLVSGNITTDSDGKITGSDSGLVIGMDLDGSFVQLSDTDGYSVMPTMQTLDQFEEAERIRLQQAVTSVIDPNQTMNPAAQQQTQQSGILDNAGGEAGAANGTGANNPPATASVSEQPTTPAQPQQIPVDDLGVKLYEQGVPVDEAIDDMQADNIKDIPAYADLAINEAQEALDKIKQPKTRAEFAQNEQKRQQLQQTIDYWTQLKQRYNERYPQYADAAPFIQQMKQAQSKRKADEVLNAALQAGVNPQEIHPVHTQKVSDLIQKEEEARKQADEVTEKDIQLIRQYRGEKAGRAYLLNRNRVPSEVRRRKIAKLIYGDLFNDDFEAWNSVEELISMWLGKGRQLDPDTFGAELNWDMTVGKDAAKVSTMFAKRRENGGDGMLFNDFVHMVSEASGVRFDTQDVRNALIEMFRGAQEKSDLTEYQLANRVAVAEQQLQAEEQRQKEMEEDNASIEDNAPIQDGLLPFGPLLPGEERPAFLEEEKKEEKPAEQPQQNVDDYVRRMNEAETHKEVDAIFKEGLAAGIAEDELFPTYSRRHKEIDNKKNEHQSKWQYNFHYDKDSGRAWIDRDDVSGPIPIGDGRWRIEGKSLEELRGILENPKNNLGELLNEVEAQLHNAEVGEQLRKESNPIAAIETAAQSFREEQKSKEEPKESNYGADNKLVTTERYEELKKRMKEKMRGQMNLGVDPEILAIGTEMAVYHIEAGARKFADYATMMINDLGDGIRNYLKAFYEGARRLPEMSELSKEMDSVSYVDDFDVLSYDKQNDNTVNEHKQENNEAENVVSLQQKASEEEGRKAEDADKYRAFSQAVANDMLNAMETGEKPYKSINDIRKRAKEVGLGVDDEGRTDILLQELVEDGLVSAARQYVNTYTIQQLLSGKKASDVRTSRDLFNDIVKLYYLQPTIAQRSSKRIKMQQYSTPLPMSFVADVFAYKDGMEDVLEPTAGNGMMVFAIPETVIHANELDETRLDNLKSQKFKEVTDQDATQPFEGRDYDAIVANPPFGAAPAKDYDGKMISGLDEQIALNALSKMKDNGRAAIIIGGNMEYAPNGAIKSDKAFFTYLYDHYNVKGVIDMDGKLYSRQGTTYPTRLILIDGRRSEEERAQVKVYPPVLKDSPMKVNTFEELFDVAEELRNDNRKTNGNEVLLSAPRELEFNFGDQAGQTNTRRYNQQPRTDVDKRNASERGGRKSENVVGETERGGQTVLGGGRQTVGDSSLQRESRPSNDTPRQRGRVEGTESRGQGESGRGSSNTTNGVVGESHPSELAGRKLVEEKRELSSDKLPYRPHNTAFSLESVAPAAMVEAMDNTLKSIEKEYGNIDEFVTNELGYDSIEDMHNALAAEQVDSVAMAIWNMKNGEGMIIGDQTGVGKGRQMAALIRWAVKQGKKPIFVTKDADLFSDIYRDLADIGSGELRPFIFNSGVTITDANGVVVHKSLSDVTQKKILAMNELPDGFDFAILSYPQMNTGDAISQEESGKAAKDRGERGAKKGKAVKAGRPTPKADFLRRIANDNYLLMDESQNAAGSGNTGAYFQSILKDAKAVTFASATFAKRPDTMPLYAIRTAISKAKVKTWELLQMIGKGGVTLQEIMSRAMTQAGQMVRRERDMSDVNTDWKTITDKATAEKARRNYDNVMRAFNAIIDFQDNYIKPALATKSMEFASMASEVTERRGTEKAGVDNPPFVNRLYNFSKQLLLSLKVDAVVDEVVSEIEAGRHPVIALENTLESALEEYGVGDVIDDPTLFGKLKKGLDATFRYTLKNEDGDEMGGELQPHELGPEGEQAYNDLVDLIKESTQGMFISPLDAITEKLEEKGYRVGEISGRKTRAVLNNDGQYVVRKRENTDRKKLARDFNKGEVDVLIINKTGSTGISLHASNRFSDQRQRTMIMAQPLSDINDYMQMIGRIDRTGQVHRGYYINLGLPVPAETRFMMMLANKLKSLNANTTTSQENKDNDVDAPDLLNKYGDQVMIEYLRDNPDVYRKLGEFLKDSKERGSSGVSAARLDEYQPKEGDARQITGRVALLSVDEQDAFYDDVTRRYNELIKYLNDTGSNDLKISVLPLNARTIDREVSSEGTAPNSGNPFADNAYVEWVDMDILKKPMKASEVGKIIEQLNPEVNAPNVEAKTAAQEKVLNSKLTPRIKQIISTVEKETQEKLDKENERYEAAKKRAEEDIAAKAEAVNKQQKRTEEQKKEAIDKYTAEKKQAVEESHQNMVNKIDANHDRLMKYLKMFGVGDSVLVPDDLTTDSFLGSSNGIFCGFKTKDEGITPSTTLAVFATLDGRRKIEVKLSDWGALTRINNMTEQNWDSAYDVTLSNWDEKIPSSSRKKGYIMTGNILQAISDTNFQGRLVTFTDDKGNVRDGVLMPDKWEPSQLKGSTVPISARKERITTLPMKESVTSSDGRVTITRYWGFYTLEVPKSKKLGGEFYLDKTLLDLVDGNDFFTASGKMRARVDNSNINAVLDRLGEMSVTLPSDKKVEFNPEQEESPKRMKKLSDNPLEAISQAAESWQNDKKNQDIKDFINGLSERFGVKGGVPTHVINSREDLEALKGQVSREVYNEIEELYNEPDTASAYLPKGDIVVVFGEKLEDVKEAEEAWWHEQAHGYWERLSENARNQFGQACFDWLKTNRPDIWMHIRNGYDKEDWLNEACSFMIGNVVIPKVGSERFLSESLDNSEEIRNFAEELKNYIQNGKQEERNNQSRRTGEGRQTPAAEVRRGDSQERGRNSESLRSEAQSELQEEVDPIKAIELSAKRWKKERKDLEEETEAVKEYSAKEVYNDRLNRVETVFSEAYQDAMVSLKTAQNAIARDNDIPDSQNAYMAENLMHGKNKNEQDMYNMKYRDPLIDTINKIMNKTGMHWGDVDRYVYTKSGLERNREFFVRDWLNSERDKSIRRYEDLNSEEQEIFDRMAARIEQDFEDGIITEEQKERKLSKALQLAHQQHIDEIENNWIETKSKSLEDLQNGTINYEGYIDNLTNFIWDNIDDDYEPEKHDYSGFTEMYGDEDGKYDEVEILDELTRTEDRIEADTVNKLWEQIRNATRYGLERYREAGMRSDEQIDQVEQMFNFYVPMRGFKKETGEDMYQYFTGKDRAKSYVGGLLKHAKGRGSEANYPISTIFAMSYKAIADCNQNLVNQKFYRLCQANPNDLVILSDSWAVFNETTGMWEEVGPDIPEDASEDEVREITLNWEDEMRQLALENKAKKITGRAKFDYKPMDKKNRSEHEIDVRINGQPKRMYVTSNPRMAQALNGQLRFGIGKNVFSKWNAAIKNMMASLFTSYSPTFALRNMFRDWTHFRTMLGVREGHGYASQANEYYRQSLYKMVGLFKKYREGKLDESNEMERDFKDFMDNGGVTGYVQMAKIDDIQKQMEKLYKQQKEGKIIRLNDNLWMKILHLVEAVNEGIENNARFATYRASRHYAGRTKARSAYDAKEITVNFNRKGAGSKTAGFKSQNKAVEDAAKVFGVTSQILGEGRIFFNATVQAIATTFKNFQNADGSFNKPYIAKWTAKYALPPFMFGLLLPAINKSLAYALGGDDDDPYANLPEWTRRKNICIYAGKYDGHDYFITIPVGQELAAFLALGDIAAGNTYSPDLKPVDRSMTDEMIGVMNTFSPVDVDTKITKGGMMEDPISESIGRTFSVLAPLVAVEQNLGWTGRPIYREDVYPSDKYNPEYQMVYQNTNPALVGASKLANDLSGGDDVVRGKVQVNPAIVQYLWEQYTGGPGKVFSNAISIGKDAKDILSGNESDFNIRKVEGLKAFVQQGDDRTSYYRALAKYRKYLEDAKKLKDAVTGYKKASATDPMALTKLEKISASEDFVRMNMILNADKELSKLNKAANKADGKERRELRKVYNKHVKEVVDMLDQVGKE